MTRYKLAAYIIDFIGVACVAFYGIGHYIKEAHAYQITHGATPKIAAQDGSFWMTTNTEPFLFPGIVLIVIGMAMVFYDIKKTMDAQASKQIVADKP